MIYLVTINLKKLALDKLPVPHLKVYSMYNLARHYKISFVIHELKLGLMLFSFLLVALFLVTFPTLLFSADQLAQPDYHISNKGSDSNPGTKQKPFATFERAFQAIQLIANQGLNKNILVEIESGIYETMNGLEIKPNMSGNNQYSITFQAAGKSKVIVSGGKKVLNWKEEANGLWSASLSSDNGFPREVLEFFVSGQRRPRARFPNKGYLNVDEAGADNRTSFTFNKSDIPKFLPGSQTEILFLHDWCTSRIGIASIDFQTRTMVFKNRIGCNARHYRINHYEKHPRYLLENNISFLDAPGEWFHDKKQERIYYKPMPKEIISSFNGIVPVAKSLLSISGTENKKVCNIHFKGIQFSYCAWAIPQGGYAAGQAGFHERRDGSKLSILREFIPAAITVNNAEQCVFDSCTFSHLGGSGVWIKSRCDNCAVKNSVIKDIAGNGILIGEDNTRKIQNQVWWDHSPKQVSKNNLIYSTLIKKCGALYKGCIGIWVGIAEGTQITNNNVYSLPYTGISLGWIWNPKPSPCRGNIVSKNHIHHVMQELSDGAGIYTLGRQPGTQLVQNWIHDIPLNLGRAESNGMFLDEGTTEILIKENVIYNIDRSPLRFHRAGQNNVDRNFLAVKEKIPTIRYNSTPEKNIHQKDNVSLPHQSWLKKDYTSFPDQFRPIIKNAGRKNVKIYKFMLNRIPD